jgi:hypothetical protein
MSMWIKCQNCGQLMEVPSCEGDGVYSTHQCSHRLTAPVPVGYDSSTHAGGGYD